MLYLIKNVYGFLLPPGIFVVLLGCLAFWMYRARTNKRMVWAAAALALATYLASIPLVGEAVIRSLEQKYPVPTVYQADGIVMLTGGAVAGTLDVDGIGSLTEHTLTRVVAAALLHKQTGLPILVSGGQVYEHGGNEGQLSKRKLISLGVPETSIVIDDQSRNTKENARNSSLLIKQLGWDRPLLVTSAFHMMRSVKHFHQHDVEVIPYPTGFRASGELKPGMNQLIPSATALDKLSLAWKEYLGMLQ